MSSMVVELSEVLRTNLEAMQGLKTVEVTVGTNLTDPPYPYFLEFGTKRMYARPSARPAYEQSKDEMVETAARVLGQQFGMKHFTQQAVRVAGLAGGMAFANRWKQIAPYETGTYKKSIHVEAETVR